MSLFESLQLLSPNVHNVKFKGEKPEDVVYKVAEQRKMSPPNTESVVCTIRFTVCITNIITKQVCVVCSWTLYLSMSADRQRIKKFYALKESCTDSVNVYTSRRHNRKTDVVTSVPS